MKKLISALCVLSMLTMSAPAYAAEINPTAVGVTAETRTANNSKTLYGDADCDGTVDTFDAVAINNYLNGNTKSLTAQGKINADAYYPGSGITREDAEAVSAYVNAEALLPVKAKKYGDADSDGSYDIADASAAAAYVNGTAKKLSIQGKANADVYQPGSGLTTEDIRAMDAYFSGRVTFPYGNGTKVTVSGDVNCDGEVTVDDVAELVQALNNKKKLSDQAWVNADAFEQGSGLTEEDVKAIDYYVKGRIRSLPTDKLPNEENDIGDDVWHEGWSFTSDVKYYTDDKIKSKGSDNSIVIQNTGFNDSRIEKTIDVEKNSKYIIKAMVRYDDYEFKKEKDSVTGSGASIGMIDGNGYAHHSDFSVSSDWTEVEYTFTTGDETKVTLFLRNGRSSGCCSGTAYFSNVRIEKVERETTDTWNALAIVYTAVRADVVDEKTKEPFMKDGNQLHYDDDLSDGQVEYIRQQLQDLETTVPYISGDRMKINPIDVHVLTPNEPLTQVETDGKNNLGVILHSAEVEAVVEPYLKEKQYDYVMFFAPLVGLTDTPTSTAQWYDYDRKISYCKFPGVFPDSTQDQLDCWKRELGMLHEMIHGVECRSREINPDMTIPLDTDGYTIKETYNYNDDTWEKWYTAYMRGEVNDGTDMKKGIDSRAYQVYRDKDVVLISDDMTVNEKQIAPATTTTTTTTKLTTTTTTTKKTATTTTTTSKTTPTTTSSKTTANNKAAYGDANCDGKVDISDSVLIMQSLSNPSQFTLTEQGKINADCTGNGDGVTNADALSIQKYLLSLIKSLPENGK